MAEATATPSASPSPAQALQASCEALPAANEPLALLSVSRGATDAILASVADPLHPRRLCSIAGVSGARFVNATTIAYARYQDSNLGSSGSIVKLDLVSGRSTVAASWAQGGFGSGSFAFSPDGKAMAYLTTLPPDSTNSGGAGVPLHLVSNGQDRVLATLPGVPGRGSTEDDDLMLAYSSDGQYLALVETFTAPGSGDRAPFQVRRADGSLVAAAPPAQALNSFSIVPAALGGPAPGARTMAVWSGTGSQLYFRDAAGVQRWAAGTNPSLAVPGLKWIRPHSSPDGHWISYTVRDGQGLPHVGLYDLTGGSGARVISQVLRAGPIFLSSTKLWYGEEKQCVDAPCATTPTGAMFIYDLTTHQETPSTIGWVLDVWPRSTQ